MLWLMVKCWLVQFEKFCDYLASKFFFWEFLIKKCQMLMFPIIISIATHFAVELTVTYLFY